MTERRIDSLLHIPIYKKNPKRHVFIKNKWLYIAALTNTLPTHALRLHTYTSTTGSVASSLTSISRKFWWVCNKVHCYGQCRCFLPCEKHFWPLSWTDFFLIFILAVELILYSYIKFFHLNLSKKVLGHDTGNPFSRQEQHSQLEFALGNWKHFPTQIRSFVLLYHFEHIVKIILPLKWEKGEKRTFLAAKS